MSRVGKIAVAIPSGVKITLKDNHIDVAGSNGSLAMDLSNAVTVSANDNEINVSPATSSRVSKAMWGTTRSRIYNMVKGVSEGFSKTLEIKGVGYRAAISGDVLSLSLGYSHEIKFIVPEDIKVTVEKQTSITISGIDNQNVGQIAAEIRSLRKPEPYKGKGVRYQDEYVRIKEGKKK